MTTQTGQAIGTVILLLLEATPVVAQDRAVRTDLDETEKKLGERLIRKTATNSDEDLMDGIIRMMNDAARRLEIEFDAGDETQEVQQAVLAGLNDAIKAAASQRRLRRRSTQPSEGDKRRMRNGEGDTSDGGSSSTTAQADAASSASNGAQGSGADGKTERGALRDLRQSWGHLPMREREEIIQGIGESFLERYREWIERYYRALQEKEE
jgi:hypothetical protein